MAQSKFFAYHRTSTKEQHLDRGEHEIKQFCNERGYNLDFDRDYYTDQQTGKNFDRPNYQAMKRSMRDGDTLIITELDRLGRNKQQTLNEIRYYKDHNIRLMVLELPTTLAEYGDDNTAAMMLEAINNMMIELFASMAQAEIEKKEKRQREGIEQKKARNEWEDYGRPKAMDFDSFSVQYQRVINGEIRPFELMKELGLTKPTFYRYKKQFEQQNT
jgi:DNA invertase Pin-like site-specific DNA recombinase